jgi:hypothetical protein
MAEIFSVSGDFGLRVDIGEYDPKITPEIDHKIRHMPFVRAYIKGKANELKSRTGSGNFEVIMSENPEQARPRAYVAPSNSEGINEEISQAVLLKAAMGMSGK